MPAGAKNEFVVVYAIAVEDTTGVRAYYNLSDTLKYGNGLDFVSAEVTYGGDGLNTAILDANPTDTAFQIEIGRASCRERVWSGGGRGSDSMRMEVRYG